MISFHGIFFKTNDDGEEEIKKIEFSELISPTFFILKSHDQFLRKIGKSFSNENLFSHSSLPSCVIWRCWIFDEHFYTSEIFYTYTVFLCFRDGFSIFLEDHGYTIRYWLNKPKLWKLKFETYHQMQAFKINLCWWIVELLIVWKSFYIPKIFNRKFNCIFKLCSW